MSFNSILGFADDLGKNLSGVLGFAEKLAPVLSLAQLGFDVFGSIKKYSEQKRYADEMRGNIEQARAANQAALAERNAQSQAVNKEKMSERARQAMAEKAKIAAIIAESGGGMSGSDARLAMMPQAALGADIAMLEANNASLNRQYLREAARLDAQAESQRNQIRDPSMLTLGADLLGSTLGFASRSRAMNPRSQYVPPLTIK